MAKWPFLSSKYSRPIYVSRSKQIIKAVWITTPRQQQPMVRSMKIVSESWHIWNII